MKCKCSILYIGICRKEVTPTAIHLEVGRNVHQVLQILSLKDAKFVFSGKRYAKLFLLHVC